VKSRDRANQSQHDYMQFRAAAELFVEDTGVQSPEPASEPGRIDLIEALEAFPRYVSISCLSKFLSRVEIFKRVLSVHGSILDCGVLHGASLLTWAKLSSIFEPVNHTRRIIGFDTFEGFPALSPEDAGTPFKPGDLRGLPMERIRSAIDCYDLNRPLAHIPKVELVKGDLAKTAAQYVEAHPELIVALLYLDVDLYEPTLAALNAFVPLMPRGAIVVFDEANYSRFPGESLALKYFFGKRTIRPLRLERHPWQSMVSFAVLE
jgi:hypothetical protein